MMAGNAEGELLPPYIVYKAENLYPTWTKNGLKGTRYNRSKSGCLMRGFLMISFIPLHYHF